MQIHDMILVSVDDHVVEPPTMFDKHIPAAYRDKAPRIESVNGNETWVYEGRRLPNIGLNAVVGRPRNEFGCETCCPMCARFTIAATNRTLTSNGFHSER